MIERYARGYAISLDGNVEATVGIEIRQFDDVEEMAIDAWSYAKEALAEFGGNHCFVVNAIEDQVKFYYPDRAYFIETEEDGKGVQVFDPRGFVKERCDCPCREGS